MVNRVSEGFSFTINGRTFDLVWDDENSSSNVCEKCAAHGELCHFWGTYSLLSLCQRFGGGHNTYFVETKPEAKPEGILEKEIVVTALADLYWSTVRAGNKVRAQEIERLIDKLC